MINKAERGKKKKRGRRKELLGNNTYIWMFRGDKITEIS